MHKIGFHLVSTGHLKQLAAVLPLLISALVVTQQAPQAYALESPSSSAPADSNQAPPSGAMQRLTQMFSPEIQRTINACWDKGKVNLAAGANTSGNVTCGDGGVNTEVAFTNYVDTISDILTASSLVGFRTVLASDPRISPQMLVAFLTNSEGTAVLRSTIESAIAQSQLLPPQSTESNTFLTDRVMERLLPNLQQPDRLENLLGTSEQYTQVVERFCTAPGMSVAQAKTLVPELSEIQLYAICIQESGVTSEALQLVQ